MRRHTTIGRALVRTFNFNRDKGTSHQACIRGRWRPRPGIAVATALLLAPLSAGGQHDMDRRIPTTATGALGGNWLSGPPPARPRYTNTDVATFNAAIANAWGSTAAIPVTIDSPTQNIGGINFDPLPAAISSAAHGGDPGGIPCC